MVTYFRDAKRYRYRKASGPLRPPTPVPPRPPSPPRPAPFHPLQPYQGGRDHFVYDPRKSGSEDMQRYQHQRKQMKRLTLPGPGPKAGGRYNAWINPKQALGMPTPFKGPLKWGKFLGRANPWMRGLDLGFQLLDMWTTTQEEDPFYGEGWTKICQTGFGPFNGHIGYIYQSGTNCAGFNSCGLTGQIPAGPWQKGQQLGTVSRGSCVALSNPGPTRTAAVGFGPITGTGSSARIAIHVIYRACWDRRCNNHGYPPAPLQWRPPIVQPLPDAAPPLPAQREQYQPRPRSRPRVEREPRTGIRLDDKPKPDTQTGTKNPPYQPPGSDHPHLPTKGERKKIVYDPRIAKLYGWLTEVKDGLKCYEEAMNIRPKGGLHDRLWRAAEKTIQKGATTEELYAFVECLVINNYQDKLIGKANQLANRITKSEYWVRPVGVGRGMFSQRMT